MKIANIYRPGYVFDGSEWVSFIGPVGPPGASIQFQGEVADLSAIPPIASRKDGYAWVTVSDGHLHVWRAADGTLVDCGQFKGPQGDKGDPGASLTINHYISDLSKLPSSTPTVGTAVFDAQTGHVLVYQPGPSASDGTLTVTALDGVTVVTVPVGWVDMGKIAGPAGPQGIQGVKGDMGSAPTFLPSVASVASLPATGNPGDIIITDNDGHAYSWDAANSKWNDAGLLRVAGAAAHPGPEVPKVADFASITGIAGEWRLCEENAHVYGWNANTNSWDDAGKMRVIPDGVDDQDLLTWDAATGTWVTTVDELGDETNVSMNIDSDNGTFFYDEGNNTFEVRKIKMADIDDGPGGVTPQAGDSLVWDGTFWEPKTITISGLDDIADVSAPTPNDGEVLTWDAANSDWESKAVSINLDDLDDVTATAPALGDVLTWDATTSMWTSVPSQSQNSPVVFVGSGTPDPTKSNVKVDNYGLPLGTMPSPQTRAPRMGDTYVDASTGEAYEVIGHTGADVGMLHLLSHIASTVHDPAPGYTISATQASGGGIVLAQNPPVTGSDPDYTRGFSALSPLTVSMLGPGLVAVNVPAGGSPTYSYTFMGTVHTVTPSSAATLDYVEIKAGISRLQDLTDVPGTGQSGQTKSFTDGEPLLWNARNNQWIQGKPPANVGEWASDVTYGFGDSVYHLGKLWRCIHASSHNVEPLNAAGDATIVLNKIGNAKGTHPLFELSGGAPTSTPPNGGVVGDWYAVKYVSDSDVTIYQWKVTGYDAVNNVANGVWNPLTFINGITVWRNVAPPPPSMTPDTGWLWIYGPEGNTNLPRKGQTDWHSIDITTYLISLADVDASSTNPGDILVSDGAGKWSATAQTWYTKSETDLKFAQAAQGMAHGMAVMGIVNDPPSFPVQDEYWIVGTIPTGAWVGHARAVTWWDGAAWQFTAPQTNETHLNEADQSLYAWSGTDWVKIAVAGTPGPAGPAGASVSFQVLTQAAYDALPTKDPSVIYLISG